MMRAMSSAPRTGLRPVKVQVGGQTLALRTDASTTYVRELAALVDSRLAEVRDRHLAAEPGATPRRPVSTQALALLCALQLADELRQAEARGRALRKNARAHVERILEHLAVLAPESAARGSTSSTAPGRSATPGRTSRRRSRRAADRAGAGAP